MGMAMHSLQYYVQGLLPKSEGASVAWRRTGDCGLHKNSRSVGKEGISKRAR